MHYVYQYLQEHLFLLQLAAALWMFRRVRMHTLPVHTVKLLYKCIDCSLFLCVYMTYYSKRSVFPFTIIRYTGYRNIYVNIYVTLALS